ncbi:SAM-dependent methyltransferase [Kitasatospora sp. NBC_01539]|uniref:SAM-dependent methyltransferase n=1 Tax=Kitasatospora sp. NBC_01539 TaxID=2903577 RepID=UPI0038600CA2
MTRTQDHRPESDSAPLGVGTFPTELISTAVGGDLVSYSSGAPSGDLQTDRPHPARLYDYYLNGKDNFAADRVAAEALLKVAPMLPTTARENRRFLERAVRYLARLGIRQFLDIGTGIPTSPNTHEIAQAEAPASRVVYVDNDPMVLAHARALLTSQPKGRTAFLKADLRNPQQILAGACAVLDFERPIALMLIAVLHFIEDSDDPRALVTELVEALPRGSCVMLSHVTGDFDPGAWENVVALYRKAGIPAQTRSRSEIEAITAGLQITPPGLQVVSRWRPDGPIDPALTDAEVSCYGVLGRKS